MSNLGLLALDLPLVMGVAVAVGLKMDKKAFKKGRQLHLEIK
jgi:hypothetical protein